MDFSKIVQKLKAKLATVLQEQNTLTVIPQEWDEELALPQGSTAKHLEKALKGSKYSIGIHDHVIRLVPKRSALSVSSESPHQNLMVVALWNLAESAGDQGICLSLSFSRTPARHKLISVHD